MKERDKNAIKEIVLIANMKRDRTFNTLFMLSSLDGKISTGETDDRDFDKDFPKISGLKEGIYQYYKLEKYTDLHSLNTGRVMEKLGANTDKFTVKCPDVSFVIIDNKHLKNRGVKNLIKRTKKLYLVTANKNHPAFNSKGRLELIYYPKGIDFKDLFKKLKQKHGISNITIQSGGSLNSTLIRKGLIDRVSIVIAPALVGGKSTSTIMDGKSLRSESDLKNIRTLKLKKCKRLKESYLNVVYDVNK